MNVLIVDDNNNNRLIISLLLEDYAKNNTGVIFNLEEAFDGLEAVAMCKQKAYDLVFMDIMMPNMDGIEATKLIRQKDKKVMIIAVSAIDDNSRKKLILNNGAEDYISKPINADLFMSRIEHYVSLVETRKSKKNNVDKINLFSDKIYKRHTKFLITSEDALSEFWEFFLLNVRAKYDNLSDVVRTIFSIADAQVRQQIESAIYIEESDEMQYFTLTNIDAISFHELELILKKNNPDCKYLLDEEKISFELEKKLSEVDEESYSEVTQKIKNPPIEKTALEPEEIASPLVFKQISQALEVFDYIAGDDLLDLEDYAGKLNSLMLIVGSGDISEDEIVDIYSYLDKMGGILATYSEVYPISKALSLLSIDMSTHIPQFMENSEALGPMCKAFSKDMSNWIEMSFHTGAPSIQFMNDTIVVNCQTISSMLKMGDAHGGVEEDFDDIFDF